MSFPKLRNCESPAHNHLILHPVEVHKSTVTSPQSCDIADANLDWLVSASTIPQIHISLWTYVQLSAVSYTNQHGFVFPALAHFLVHFGFHVQECCSAPHGILDSSAVLTISWNLTSSGRILWLDVSQLPLPFCTITNSN